MDKTNEQRTADFLAAENWFEDERLEAIYRQITEGVIPEIPDPLATEYVQVLMQLARAQQAALIELAKAIDELEKKAQGDS